MKKVLIFIISLFVFATLSAKIKFDERTVRAELRKPGVKLVAVDFYMTGCPPCDKAIKKWKELKQQYGDTLKLIVVAPQRPDGSCNVKGWNPDRMICDYGQEIAGNWGVRDFPQAFLYSWHNDYPLLEHSQVKDVEEKIKEYLKNIPRVAIDADKNTKNLVPLIEEELIRNSKIELVANESERKRLVELREESYNGQYDDDLRCELGKEISANSVLKVTKQGADLVLRLSSVAKSCTMAASTKTLSSNQRNLKTEIAAAVYDLLSQMFGHISKPHEERDTAFPTVLSGNKTDDWEISNSAEIIVKFDSNPTGAAVSIDGKVRCQMTPCSKSVTEGTHKIEIIKDDGCYKEWEETITIGNNKKSVHAEMKPRESAIKVYAQDEKGNDIDADVFVDNTKVGITPGTFKVPLCSKKLFIKNGDLEYSEELSLKEKQIKTIQGQLKRKSLQWSKRSPNEMDWNAAKKYCVNLTEGGFTDWRLPNIDELRTTIKNCPKTETGGECKISEKNGRLSSEDWTSSCLCEFLQDNGGYYSKFGDDDRVLLWSSSAVSDEPDRAWAIAFVSGLVSRYSNKINEINVRCVR